MLTIIRTGKTVTAIGTDKNGEENDAPCEFSTIEEAESFYTKMQGCDDNYEWTVEFFKAIGMY